MGSMREMVAYSTHVGLCQGLCQVLLTALHGQGTECSCIPYVVLTSDVLLVVSRCV